MLKMAFSASYKSKSQTVTPSGFDESVKFIRDHNQKSKYTLLFLNLSNTETGDGKQETT